jgi:hypothetical protein
MLNADHWNIAISDCSVSRPPGRILRLRTAILMRFADPCKVEPADIYYMKKSTVVWPAIRHIGSNSPGIHVGLNLVPLRHGRLAWPERVGETGVGGLMRKELVWGVLCVAVSCFLSEREAVGQFTQGPPGNPSAAGITTGNPPPVPVPPTVMPPPRAPGSLPFMGIPQRSNDSDAVDSPESLFAAEGVPPLLAAYRESPLSRYLDLSGEQVSKIGALRTKFFRDTKDLGYDLSKKRLEMRRLFADPTVDAAALLLHRKDLASLRMQITDVLVRATLEAREILKPDQVEMLDHFPLNY